MHDGLSPVPTGRLPAGQTCARRLLHLAPQEATQSLLAFLKHSNDAEHACRWLMARNQTRSPRSWPPRRRRCRTACAAGTKPQRSSSALTAPLTAGTATRPMRRPPSRSTCGRGLRPPHPPATAPAPAGMHAPQLRLRCLARCICAAWQGNDLYAAWEHCAHSLFILTCVFMLPLQCAAQRNSTCSRSRWGLEPVLGHQRTILSLTALNTEPLACHARTRATA